MNEELLREFRQGSKRAAARIISLIENEEPAGVELLKELYGQGGHGYIVGITGPAGSGKSTLTDVLVKHMRQKGYRVGVVAVDPTSPFTGGALLGDRVRMNDLALDPGVFIRSMGTRGQLGGLSWAVRDALVVLDAFGCDYLLVETVGAGQTQVDIARVADTIVLVTVPGLGDDIQAAKAGIMEIGDIFVVNKADRGDADQVVRYLQTALEQGSKQEGWQPPILKTVAWRGEGVEELWHAIMQHRSFLEQSGLLEPLRQQRVKEEVIERAERMVLAWLKREVRVDELIEEVYNRRLDPYSAAERLVDKILRAKDQG
ncbi:MAG: methylmalonyl Co-A mutase-associated GTPase MeaB [Thermoanaerobacteraceae bacterium]|uniref:methylmalonyl Co-A mutase-associated GTPase MeaB n=1 Tax=Thermanaeromonas sp. C210 TaxID=2731925 RepID=UPI00155B9626|nr:methylmalonyl Co-A mutase-associated GTPase MeaB [Thermanaeromonas sp. C210]MBE3581956.1 methylmalonyl Co-A mutase-associated GTPase MeaB [Thermoanaerobacteraceae bacterium]GFN22267.1 methylmalonyl Co-A mutase-associated GTPase MeaB [Thermanaeromonas sp. C210]